MTRKSGCRFSGEIVGTLVIGSALLLIDRYVEVFRR